MESKQLIQTLSAVAGKVEKMQTDVEQIKLELAKSEKVNKLENRMAAMEVKVWVLFGVLAIVASAVIGYLFKNG